MRKNFLISYIFCFSLFLLTKTAVYSADMAYLWHRVRGEKTEETLKTFQNWQIYALSAEIRKNSSRVVLKRLPGTIPVIRLDQFCWHEEAFLKKFLSVVRQLPEGEIQLDCDVPETKIAAYADFLKHLKKEDKKHSYSVTILPCHLKHEELKDVLSEAEYAVLQLHALEIPGDLPQEYSLFDFSSADAAVRKMQKFSTPFKIALPSYAYTVHYGKNGKFRRLSAENEPPGRDDEIRLTAAPDWEDVLRLRRKYPHLDVIWFRLPHPGDRMALEAENLIRLSRGEMPRREAELFFRKNQSCTDVYLKNHGLLGRVPHKISLGGTGEIFFFNGAEPEGKENVSGKVPPVVSCELPPPGETVLAAKILDWKKEEK